MQKARTYYEYLINMDDDPDVLEPLKFLREKEIAQTINLLNVIHLDKVDY